MVGDTHVCTSRDPEIALNLAPAYPATGREQSSSPRDLVGEMPIHAFRTRSVDFSQGWENLIQPWGSVLAPLRHGLGSIRPTDRPIQ